MSRLYYSEEAAQDQCSKWGFEFTFRLASSVDRIAEQPPLWPIAMMNNLARYVSTSGNWFEHGHHLHANGPILLESDTSLTGILLWLDPELGATPTPHGNVDFLQVVGLTEVEIQSLVDQKTDQWIIGEALLKESPLLVTRLDRSASLI